MADEEVSCGCFRSLNLGFFHNFIKVFLLLNLIFERNLSLATNINLSSVKKIEDSEIVPSFSNYVGESITINYVDSSKQIIDFQSTIHNKDLTANIDPVISSSIINEASIVPSMSRVVSLSILISTTEKSLSSGTASKSSSAATDIISSALQSLVTSSIEPSISTKSVESSSAIPSYSTFVSQESIFPSCHIVTQTSFVCLETASHSSNISSWALETISTSVITSSAIQTSIAPSSSALLDSSKFVTTSTELLSPSLSTTIQMISSSNIPYSSVLSSSISPSSSQVQSISASILTPAVHICDVVANNFSIALNNYTTCVLVHLKPMEVCFKCIQQYETLKLYHRKVYHDCGKRLITRYNAQYQVIAHLFEIQQRTWNSLECEKCYDRSSQDPVRTPQFEKFRELFKETTECFHSKNFPNATTIYSNSSANISGSVCHRCKPLYNVLQSEFKYQADSDEETVTQWCADINVSVNETRHVWSFRYHCGKRDKDMVSIIAMTCFFCFLPIVFYVGAKLHADVKERKSSRYYESQ
ncbi:uncharacterized protein [Clytia hemisphaerica]|uniref:Uncharacterized protein n=1 Tax=Clytia hemisphaerica TaxID=252671 RepID=A0A7M5URU6_9CNID